MAESLSLEAIAANYLAGTRFFDECIAQVNADNIDKCEPGEWTARQVIHHVADSEAQSYARLRRLLAEPNPVIQGYDEAAWAECEALGYQELPIENSVAVFRAVRAASLDLIQRLTPSQLSLVGVHTESGPYDVAKWIATYSNHPREHGEQLLRALNS